ncbi:DksA/TraR family C4-type zinc finger protein [Ferrimonas aestuarii]|uniref:DksA/TraR family C4-type zinc finger protein n=1 Tax=Ferrimonas aestuarii TaxID=2569539 RepID=A0A4U1BDT2_9GAMM|nr:DksA/TraR family C4-type zinc finger protein [Ferrimonas aestuarii]TKB49180.1 DksA/TraR family C4-type zinc finger protein [Ferrimonas aestuarii]
MAGGFSKDGAVSEQIDVSINDAVSQIHNRLPDPNRPSAAECDECGEPISEARRRALPGVRLCIQCQTELDKQQRNHMLFNRRGSKDSQLR